MAARCHVDPNKLYETLRQSIFPKATDAEMLALIVVANTYGLNVFLKELYGFPAKGGGIVPVVSVDGWNSLLIRQPDFDGIEFSFEDDDQGNVFSCTATIYVKSRSKPVKITEFYAECVRASDPWKNMPRRMLRNRTLCQASRMAFGISGIRHEEEAEAINIDSTVIQSETKPLPLPTEKLNTPAPQTELEASVVGGGFTFDHLQKWGLETGNIEGADSLTGFADVPREVATRLLRNKEGLINGLTKIKG